MCNTWSYRVSKTQKACNMLCCPECRGKLVLGSTDPCEGDYFWCDVCGEGPFLFPLGGLPGYDEDGNYQGA